VFQALVPYEGSIERICGDGDIPVVVVDASPEVDDLMQYVFGERSLGNRVFAMKRGRIRAAARQARARHDAAKARWFERQDARGEGRVVLVLGTAIMLLDISPSGHESNRPRLVAVGSPSNA
jgi:hypothetical protein